MISLYSGRYNSLLHSLTSDSSVTWLTSLVVDGLMIYLYSGRYNSPLHPFLSGPLPTQPASDTRCLRSGPTTQLTQLMRCLALKREFLPEKISGPDKGIPDRLLGYKSYWSPQ
jgi:hypothetical protein